MGSIEMRLPEMGGVERALCRGLRVGFGWLGRVEGAERLGGVAEPAVYALNHNNSFEAVIAPAVLMALRGGRSLHFVTDWMFLQVPVLGWVIRRSAPIPVYRKRARFGMWEGRRQAGLRRPAMAECLARLAAGGSVGIFPEGTRNPDPARLLRGRSGLGEMVLAARVPVVPIGIHYPAAARLGRAPKVGRMVMRIGRPLAFEGEGDVPGAARGAAARRVVELVMSEIAELSGKQNPKRRSP
jgi:1-acyl-sn-glycerol-3-phosphate acyltransferase